MVLLVVALTDSVDLLFLVFTSLRAAPMLPVQAEAKLVAATKVRGKKPK